MKNSPSKTSLRRLVEQESGYEVLISTSAWHSLAKRAGKNAVPLSIVEQVYARGYLSADEDSKNSPEQQAFQRVDSFLHGGQAQNLDEDLMEIAMPKGHRHMHIVKNAIKRYENRENPLKEDMITEKGVPPLGYTTAKGIVKGARWAYRKYKETKEKSETENQEKQVSSTPKRRKFKYEIAAETKRRNERIRKKSISDADAHQKRVSQETGISQGKIHKGHGSGPLTRDELDRIVASERGQPSPKAKHPLPKTKGRYKEKLKVWAIKKLRGIRKKYENE